MGETIKQNNGVYESSIDNLNLKEDNWAKIQMTNTLKILKLNQENSFYKVDKDNSEVSYDMAAVKSYLESIKDKPWEDLTSKNTGAWIMAVQIAMEALGKDVGQIDGVLGRKGKDSQTRRAIREFQNENGLIPADGLPGKQTIKKILEELEDLNIQTNPANPQNSNDNNIEIPEKPEIPEELKDFRKAWKEKIKGIDDATKQKIENAAEKINVKVETESDGSRLIEFELGGKTWKILDPKLKTHSDGKYFREAEYTFITKRDQRVKLGGMMGDDVSKWKNKKLSKYVQEKQREGLSIAKIEDMKNLLGELGKNASLNNTSEQIAMLMYLTGMDGYYWLTMGDHKNSNSQASSRSFLKCFDSYPSFYYYLNDDYYASLCMIACN